MLLLLTEPRLKPRSVWPSHALHPCLCLGVRTIRRNAEQHKTSQAAGRARKDPMTCLRMCHNNWINYMMCNLMVGTNFKKCQAHLSLKEIERAVLELGWPVSEEHWRRFKSSVHLGSGPSGEHGTLCIGGDLLKNIIWAGLGRGQS